MDLLLFINDFIFNSATTVGEVAYPAYPFALKTSARVATIMYLYSHITAPVFSSFSIPRAVAVINVILCFCLNL